MWKPNVPKFLGSEFTEGYEDVPTNPEAFEGQTVLILGNISLILVNAHAQVLETLFKLARGWVICGG